MTFYNEIIPNLFIGSIEASTDYNFIEKNKISIIVNCSKNIENKFTLNLLKPIEDAPQIVKDWLFDNSYYIKYYRINVDDNGKPEEIDNFYKLVTELLPIIDYEYKKGKSILVHCLAGNQRSAAFICAFLIYAKKFTLNNAVSYLLEKKPNVFFFGNQINFKNALIRIEKHCNILIEK
jgi:protein-tyrosine phosphatase